MDEAPKKIFEGRFVVLFCTDGPAHFSLKGKVLKEDVEGGILLFDHKKKAERLVSKKIITNTVFFESEEAFLADVEKERLRKERETAEKEAIGVK